MELEPDEELDYDDVTMLLECVAVAAAARAARWTWRTQATRCATAPSERDTDGSFEGGSPRASDSFKEPSK